MKALIKNNNLNYTSFKSNNLANLKQAGLNKYKRQNEAEKKNINNQNRPAQALSFGGSLDLAAADAAQKAANSGLRDKIYSKFTQSSGINKMIGFTADNEAAFNAIYSLIFAGILKPICVIHQKGSDEKDKQYIATKNFLQAFIGSFLGLTVGGGIIKKITDVITNNLKMISVDDVTKEMSLKGEPQALKLAKKSLDKKYSSLGTKINLAKETRKDLAGFEKVKQFAADVRKNISLDFKNNQVLRTFKENGEEKTEAIAKDLSKELEQKAKSITETASRHLSFFKDHPEYVEELTKSMADGKAKGTLYDAYESVLKNSTGWITAIMKAKISSILLPTVVALFFTNRAAKKVNENKANENKTNGANPQQNQSVLLNSKIFKQENENYKALLNKQESSKDQKAQKQVSFGKGLDNTIDIGAQIVENISLSKPMEKFTKGLFKLPSPLNKPSARMGDIESGLITTYWVLNTLRSKKIDPSQKLGINIHTILVSVVSSICAFIIDTALDGAIGKAGDKYKDIIEASYEKAKDSQTQEEFAKIMKENCSKLFNSEGIEKKIKHGMSEDNLKDTVTELTNNYSKKLSKFKSLIIFTAVVRFLVPVLLVPYSGKLKNIVMEKSKKKEEQAKVEDKKA